MSIRKLFIIILIIFAIVPLLAASTFGTLYYRNTLQQSIEADEQVQARAVANLTALYTSSSLALLESTASRPTLINAVESGDVPFVNTSLQFLLNRTPFDRLYITNVSGGVVTGYPAMNESAMERIDLRGQSYVASAIDYYKNSQTGVPAIYISVPITGNNGSRLGTLTGEMKADVLADMIQSFQLNVIPFYYIVDRTGHIIVHNNRTYMATGADFSSVQAVRSVISGNEGVLEQYNPVEGETRLVAFSPMPSTGWGVVVAVPLSVAYAPVENTTRFIVAGLLIVALLSVIVAVIAGDYIARPILGIAMATTKVTNGGGYQKYLPLGRKDEIGDLARKFDSMSRKIRDDRERIENEKNRTELYLDIMGHDINNLNQTAMTNLELLEMAKTLTPGDRGMVADALKAVRGSAEVIDNVRLIQAIGEGKLPTETVDINGLIEQCIAEVPRPAGRNVVIDYQSRNGLMVKASPVLKQVFCNVIANAIKHSDRDVTIKIIVEESEKSGIKYYDVIIEDNGPGIPDELKSRLFGRFQRGATKAHGKGLGLYIVRTLVERFGGSVAVGDRVAGDYTQGAKFTISLPAEAS